MVGESFFYYLARNHYTLFAAQMVDEFAPVWGGAVVKEANAQPGAEDVHAIGHRIIERDVGEHTRINILIRCANAYRTGGFIKPLAVCFQFKDVPRLFHPPEIYKS